MTAVVQYYTETYYKAHYIMHGLYDNGMFSVNVEGDDLMFDTFDEAKKFIDEQPGVEEFEA